jgi:large conductance mechanosensitive channel
LVKAFLAEFKEFINKGNLLGIAIGFVMGVATAAVVTALVDNIIMPIVAIPFGKPNFDDAMILTVHHSQIRFGAFVTAVVTFLAIAITVFILLKAYNKVTKGEATAPPNELVVLSGILTEMRGMRADLATANADGDTGPGDAPS